MMITSRAAPEGSKAPSTAESAGTEKQRQHIDLVSVVSAIILLCLPVAFICLNFWSARFMNFSYRVLQPVSDYMSRQNNYMFASMTRFVWVNLLALCFTLVAHELGHLAAGILSGFRFESIALAPLQIDRAGRVSIGLESKNILLGFVKMRPRKLSGLRFRCLIVALGGPIANLVAAATMVVLTDRPLAGCLVIWSGAAGLANLIPFRHLRFQSDGRAIYALLFERT